MDRYSDHYKEIILNDFFVKKKFGHKHRVSKLDKVVLNLGVKDITQDKRKILSSILGAEVITGQRALITKSRNENDKQRTYNCIKYSMNLTSYAISKC